jgi:hypothetical protein
VKSRTFLWMALVASACQPPPGQAAPPKYYLEGSLGQVMSIGYDEARVLMTGEDVSLTFVRIHPFTDTTADGGSGAGGAAGTTEDYPVKVTYTIVDGGTPEGVRVDLTELDTAGKQRGIVSRYVLNDPRRDFPDLSRGTMYFAKKILPNTVVHGDFNCTFDAGIESASGRTVFGTFDAKVVQ